MRTGNDGAAICTRPEAAMRSFQEWSCGSWSGLIPSPHRRRRISFIKKAGAAGPRLIKCDQGSFSLGRREALLDPVGYPVPVPEQVLVACILQKDDCAGRPPAFYAISVESDGVGLLQTYCFGGLQAVCEEIVRRKPLRACDALLLIVGGNAVIEQHEYLLLIDP